MRVFTQTDDTTRHIALELIFCGHIARSRTSKAHWQTKTLCRTADDVSAPRTRRLEQSQCHQVSDNRHLGSRLMCLFYEIRVVLNGTVRIGPLYYSANHLRREAEISITSEHQLYPLTQSACLHYGTGVGKDALIHKHFVCPGFDLVTTTQVAHHRNRLGGSSGFIQQRAVSQRQPGQVANHSLIHKQRLQTALRNLSLIRSVTGVPNGVLQYITDDDSRSESVVPSAAYIGLKRLVFCA